MEIDVDEYQKVKSSLNSVPLDVSSKFAQLSARERNIADLNRKCQVQIKEIRERSTTLHQYATSLVTMQGRIQQEKNNYEKEFQERTHEIDFQLEEAKKELKEILMQLADISKLGEKNNNLEGSLHEKIKDLNDEEQKLNKKYTSYEMLMNLQNDKPIEPIDESIIEKIQDLHAQIHSYQQEINKQQQKNLKIKELVDQYNNKKTEYTSRQAQIGDAIQQKVTNLQNEINSMVIKKKKYEMKYNEIDHVTKDMDIAIIAIKNRLKKIEQKISKTTQVEEIIKQKLEPLKKIDQNANSSIEAVLNEGRKYHVATAQRIDFYKQIAQAKLRSQERSNDLLNAIETTKTLRKEADVATFEFEASIERDQEAIDTNKELLEKVEQELAVSCRELDETTAEFNGTEAEFNSEQKKIEDIQNTIIKKRSEYKSIKAKIENATQKERKLIEAFNLLKSQKGINSPEIEEVRKRFENINGGYLAKTKATQDQVLRLSKAIETEELRHKINGTEMSRLSVNLPSQTLAIHPSSLQDFSNLKTEISRLEEAVSKKEIIVSQRQTEVHNRSLDLSTATVASINGAEIERRAAAANETIQDLKQLLKSINSSKVSLSDEKLPTYEKIVHLNKWNSMLTEMISNAELYC